MYSVATVLLSLSGVVVAASAGYTLADEYTPGTLLAGFDFFSGADPTNGQ